MTRLIRCHLGARDTQRTADLLARNNPNGGVLSVLAAVDSRRNAVWLARDILVALGKPCELDGNNAYSADAWCILPIWICAAGITDIIVVDAHRMGAGRTADLASLACETGINIWFFTHDPQRDLWRNGPPGWPLEHLDWDDVATQLPPIPTPAPPAPPSGPPYELADLPMTDHWTFRSDARRALPADMFAAVDHLYVTTVLDTQAWISADTSRPDIEERLRDLVADHSTAGERLVAIRGYQTGLLRGGWHLGIAIDGFAALAGAHPGRVLTDTDERWTRMGRWWQPHRGAACALAAIGIPDTSCATLTMADITDTTVTTPAGKIGIPEPARPLLLAQRLNRLSDGAQPDDPFFARLDGNPVDAAWISDIVRAAGDAGAAIPVPGSGKRQRWHDSSRLARRLGLRIHHLAGHELPPATINPPATPAPAEPREVAEGSILQTAMLTRRRFELGFTRRALARSTGLSEQAIYDLENGTIPTHMGVHQLLEYANALSVHPSELLGGTPPQDPDTEPTSDAAALGALLWSTEQTVPATAAADALGWDTPRLRDAARTLDSTLRPAGLRLAASETDLTLLATNRDLPEPAQVAATARAQQLRRGIGLHRVKTLTLVANRTPSPNGLSGGHTLMQLRYLTSAGLIEPDPAGGAIPVVTADVADSLMLTSTRADINAEADVGDAILS